MKTHCRHDWSKWDQYEVSGTCQVHPFSKHTLPFSEVRQQRRCTLCNKIENERLPTGTRLQRQPTQQEMNQRAAIAPDVLDDALKALIKPCLRGQSLQAMTPEQRARVITIW